MECVYCGQKIAVLRKLQHAEFCSAAHQKAYLKKQEALALDFLMQNKKRSPSKVPQVPPVETAPSVPSPPQPQPLPAAADFVAERAAPARIETSLERIARPRILPLQPILPAARGLISSVAESVAKRPAPARLEASVKRDAQPRSFLPQPALPAARGLSSPAVHFAGFAGLTAAADVSLACAPAAGRTEFPFTGEPPRIRETSIGPLWIAPERQAPA